MISNLVELSQPENLGIAAFQFAWPAVQPRQTGIKVGKIKSGTGSQIVRVVVEAIKSRVAESFRSNIEGGYLGQEQLVLREQGSYRLTRRESSRIAIHQKRWHWLILLIVLI